MRIRRRLTPRQVEILNLIKIGKTDKEIAADLDIKESTVGMHVSSMLMRLGAKSRAHAVYLQKQ